MAEYFQVTEHETQALIGVSGGRRGDPGRRVCRFSFGPGGVALLDTPENRWAIELVKKYREHVEYRSKAHEHDL